MAVSDGYIELVHDLLSAFEPLRIKRMFGGAGVYSDELFFAVIIDDALYLKVDDETRARYEARGLRPFTYAMRNGRAASMSYYPVPADILEDTQALAAWAHEALEAARRASARRAPRPGKAPRAS